MIWTYIAVTFLYFCIWYAITQAVKNAGLIDVGWGFGFVLLAWIGFVQTLSVVSLVLTAMVTLWGLRLTYHVFKRNVGKPEDYRYAKFRADWGKWFSLRAFFQLFMFQALMMVIISLAFIYGNSQSEIIRPALFVAGILVFTVGFLFEAVGDAQLKRFVSQPDNKGKLIETGLWRYTRHPNYFGEAMLWWGVYLSALAAGAPWWTVISPITITLLIRFVSGVPMLERRNKNKAGFEAYSKRVNIFVPWFRKESE
ncbi:MAG: DUF1295 domain-containing protein [Eubacteriales bacterium]